jgi:hypothetical protein
VKELVFLDTVGLVAAWNAQHFTAAGFETLF